MNNFTITGLLHQVGEVEQVNETFKKREFVIELMTDPNKRQFASFQLANDRVDLIKEYSQADEIEVTFAYLGGGLEERSRPVGVAELEAARGRLATVVAGLAAEDYTPAPSDRCRRCDFLAVCAEGRAGAG